jgi:cytochrome c553
MKRIILVLIVIMAVAGFAAAQVTSPTADTLGAHNVYGRGCVACHAPHSGAAGNGLKPAANSGNVALWGEDMSPLYGKTLAFGDQGSYTVTLPDYTNGQPMFYMDNYFGIIACLSCHDGNLAKQGMMKGTTVETVTIAGATFNPPTLLGNDTSTVGNYMNDHPVGPKATVGCGGTYDWDCTYNADGSITFGTNGQFFLTNYFDVTKYGPVSALVKVKGGTGSWVSCTTCHDQHNMLYFNDGTSTIKPTRFFVRGWYNPGNTNTSNSAAQFCRSCHGGEANEMHGQTGVPTT